LQHETQTLKAHTRTVERRLRWWRLSGRVAAMAALGLALALPHTVQAKTFSCRAGDAQCLIDAIHEANANGEANTIRLKAGTYTLTAINNDTNGLPVMTSHLTIVGAGAETTIIERDASAPAFRLVMVAAPGTVTLTGLTLRGGGSFGIVGGGIANSGTLTVTHSAITDNFASFGGGIANSGTLTVTHSAITDNQAIGNGGIDNLDGTVTIIHSTIAHNVGGHDSGGLFNSMAGTVRITGTTFASNGADGAGAIFNFGRLTVTNSSFTDNNAFFTGTGTIQNGGLLEVTNTTFARNVTTSFGFSVVGVAIANAHTLLLTNSTLADNEADEPVSTSGSALASYSGATTILQNTLLARNVGSIRQGSGPDCIGVVISLGHNLIGDLTGCTITLQPTDLTGDPGLGDFADNGTPGNGHIPLLKTSQAIDAGNKAVCPRTDQLGRLRLGACDIGAIEFRHRDNRQDDEEDNQHDKDLAATAQTAP